MRGRELQKFVLFFFPAVVLSLLTLSVFAEPPGFDTGAEAQRYKTKVEEEKKRLEYEEPKPAEVEMEEEAVAEKPVAEAVYFVLKDVEVSGVTVFPAEEITDIYSPYLDKKVGFNDLSAIVESIKAKYKEAGYVTTVVYLPQQDIVDGVVKINVVEGKMGELEIEDNKWFSSSFIRKFFHLKKNEVLNIKKLQRDILRLNKNSDLEVKTVITPGKEVQTSDIILKVTDTFPHHVGGGVDNQGTRLVGKIRTSGYYRSSNLTGRGDVFYLNSLWSSRSLGESISYIVPIDTYGTKCGIDFTYFDMKVGKEYKQSNISGITYMGTPHLSKELYLSDDFEVYADIGMEMKSIKKKIADTMTTHDELRLPYFGFNFEKINLYGSQTSFAPKFTFSIDSVLGASDRNHPSSSRAESGGFFFRYEQGFKHIRKMPADSYMIIRSQFQVPTHTLPSSEQLQLGGLNSIRGYPEGDYLADIGAYLDVDWVFPMYLIPEKFKLPKSKEPLRKSIEPVVFFDVGGGKLINVDGGEIHNKFLAGVGGGLRIRIGRYTYIRLEWAEHVGERPTRGSGPSTFHFSVQMEK